MTRRLARTTLLSRVVAVVILALAVALTSAGFVASHTLQTYLQDKVDSGRGHRDEPDATAAEVDATVDHLEEVELVVGAAVLVVAGAATAFGLRRAFRPLQSVGATASAIAAGDLSQRVPWDDDVTEVGRLGRALNAMLGNVEQAFRAQQASERQARESELRMRRFVSDAGHELRTPLTSIRGFAELHRLQDRASDPGVLLDRIAEESRRMGLLVEDLLLLARLDEQRPLRAVPVDVPDVAAAVLHAQQVVAAGRVLSLSVRPGTRAPIVTGDPDRLHQVLSNLVGNAVQHTAGPVEVSVSTDRTAVQVDVADHGPGLSAEAAARVFERFYRVDDGRSRAGGGSGLGLAIVAALVERHGGTVSVTATPGGGATFRVRLPLES